MEREAIDQIERAISVLAAPWSSRGVEAPAFTVKEISRQGNIAPETIYSVLTKSVQKEYTFVDANGEPLDGQGVQDEIQCRAPFKRSVRETPYRSTAPGGGPVVKRRVIQKDLVRKMRQNGLARVRVNINPEETPSSRDVSKQRLADKWVKKSKELSQEIPESIASTIRRNSRFSMINEAIFTERASIRLNNNEPITIACFLCLPMRVQTDNGSIVYDIGEVSEKTQEISPRVVQLVQKLTRVSPNVNWMFLIADSEPYDVYGPWLKGNDIEESIESYIKNLSARNPTLSFARWSTFKKDLSELYCGYFDKGVSLFADDSQYTQDIQKSYDRRRAYFQQQKIVSKDCDRVAFNTAVYNRALYAAEGPIINKLFDALAIIDPDPTRLAQNHMVFDTTIPILFPNT